MGQRADLGVATGVEGVRRGTRRALLKEKLDELYLSYDISYIHSDPIQFPHRYLKACDRETAAFIASVLAYGSVSSIKRSLEKIFSVLGAHPYDALLAMSPNELLSALHGFRHRFTTSRHLVWFLSIVRNALSEYGSLKALFLEGYSPHQPSIKDSLIAFVNGLRSYRVQPVYQTLPDAQRDGALFVLPSPQGGGACKRLNLFLRWMVRTGDSIDLGLWREVSASQLVIPLDTHVGRLSRYLGLTHRKASDWNTAEEITQSLRSLDPIDPLKYDFSLARLGILGNCVGRDRQRRCDQCRLVEICSRERSSS